MSYCHRNRANKGKNVNSDMSSSIRLGIVLIYFIGGTMLDI